MNKSENHCGTYNASITQPIWHFKLVLGDNQFYKAKTAGVN